ncbi:hypothetical protein AYO38_09940 [bacterium SCGC AG-212-C10]|nr:hypothetical protein AYO38_09940 [bacterium SCGC AG-212-C10]
MSVFEPPHGPAEPDPPREFFKNPLLPQGAGLGGLAVLALLLLVRIGRKSTTAGVVLGPVLFAAAALAAWASAIHLTGGERFDDHPWV